MKTLSTVLLAGHFMACPWVNLLLIITDDPWWCIFRTTHLTEGTTVWDRPMETQTIKTILSQNKWQNSWVRPGTLRRALSQANPRPITLCDPWWCIFRTTHLTEGNSRCGTDLWKCRQLRQFWCGVGVNRRAVEARHFMIYWNMFGIICATKNSHLYFCGLKLSIFKIWLINLF